LSNDWTLARLPFAAAARNSPPATSFLWHEDAKPIKAKKSSATSARRQTLYWLNRAKIERIFQIPESSDNFIHAARAGEKLINDWVALIGCPTPVAALPTTCAVKR